MKTPLIFIVDNDLISNFEIKIRLRQSQRPCKIVCFGDTDSAFEMLVSNFGHEQALPDIMIVNFNLAGLDGLSFLKAVESNALITDRTALYVYSTFNISNERIKFEQVTQIKGYFTKPPSKKDIQKIFEDYNESTNAIAF